MKRNKFIPMQLTKFAVVRGGNEKKKIKNSYNIQ